MKQTWSILCGRAVVDKETNLLSLIDLIEQIHISLDGKPEDASVVIIPIQIVLASLWERDEKEPPAMLRLRVTGIAPENKVFFESDQEADLLNHKRFRCLFQVKQLPFMGSGKYEFATDVFDTEANEWQRVSSNAVEVVENPPAKKKASKKLAKKK